MKFYFLSICSFLCFQSSAQVVNDTIPRPLSYFYPCSADSILSESHSDSLDYIAKTTSFDGFCNEYFCEFDSVSYSFTLGNFEPIVYIRNAKNSNEFIAISFYHGMSKLKQIHTRKGSVETKVDFSIWGELSRYFECDYSVCDKCISELYGANGKEGGNETIYYTPVTCIQDLDWIRLKPEFKGLQAVPIRIVLNDGTKCLVDRVIPLTENYTKN